MLYLGAVKKATQLFDCPKVEDMYEKWLYMMAMAALVAAGALSLLFWTRRTLVATVILTLAALYVGFRRDTYLPFLGETVMPCSLLEEKTPEHADAHVNVSGLVPGAKVLFWASERNEPASAGLAKIKDWRRAYLAFANAGVTTADEGGHAVLRVRTPQPYTVPLKGRLEAHVHWRVCRDGGMLGPVETTLIPQ
jgi:hypothetical protein